MAGTLSGTPSKSSQISYPDGKPEDDLKGAEEGAAKEQQLPLAYDKAPWYTYLRVPFTMKNPPPPQGTLDEASIIPDTTANFFSLLTYAWVLPMLNLGYARPLETTDLWKLDDSRAAGLYADRILESFDRDISPSWPRKIWWGIGGNYEARERQWRQQDGKKKPSLAFAMNDAVKWFFWSGGLLKIISDMAQITTPLVIKAIIKYVTEFYEIRKLHPTAPTPSVGRGVGLAITLFLMQIIASSVPSACIPSFSRNWCSSSCWPHHRDIQALSPVHGSSAITASKWEDTPIQMVVCLILLLLNLGVSALAGFALFIVITPALAKAMGQFMRLREKSMVWTDKRAKLLQELLGGMRVIKFFAWEIPFLKRIGEYRTKELQYIRMLLVVRALTNAIAFSLPVLSAVVAFIVYSVMGHSLRPDVIFASLSLFQLLRLPLLLLPLALGSIADAANAVGRLTDVFTAELLDETRPIDPALPKKTGAQKREERKEAKRLHAVVGASGDRTPQVKDKAEDEGQVFKLKNLNLEIPRGQLCAIVGPLVQGKAPYSRCVSSLSPDPENAVPNISLFWEIKGILGEMRRTEGEVIFGGSVSYAAQSAWIQSCSVRDNILFGREFDEEKYWKVIYDASLNADLDMLPHGTKRSALDAHVGKHVFEHAVQGALAGKTRVLVTHALHFLPQTDYIITMLDGRIVERGTYEELVKNNGDFAQFISAFGSQGEQEKHEDENVTETDAVGATDKKRKSVTGTALMQAEERALGAVSSKTIDPQLQSFVGLGIGQALSLFLLGSAFAVMTFFASVKMHKDSIQRVIHAPMSFFETTPLGRIMNRFSKDVDTLDNTLGEALRMMTTTLSQIIGAVILISILLPWFLIPVGIVILLYFNIGVFYRSSARELKRLDAILRSSLYSHFSESLSGLGTIRAYGETTRFTRENEQYMDHENRAYWLTITNQRWLGVHLDFLGAILSFAVAILAVASPFSISPSQTGVALSYILSVQQSFGWMIRQVAEVENDMNAVERVHHYSHNLEQEAPHRVDDKKPPPHWPSRGDLELNDISLSYRPGLPLVLKGLSLHVSEGEHIGIVGRTGAGKSSILVALYRLVELNSGSITLDGIDVSTLGLTDLRSKIASEHLESIRPLDCASDAIVCENHTLVIPQDPTLFSGTLRSNLDPFGIYDDARLWDALKRSALVDDVGKDEQKQEIIDGPSSPTSPSSYAPQSGIHYGHRFTLDSPVEDEGGNLSVGQRSLVSLARALVKDSQVVLLDEATASVDYETDQNIQNTIASEFSHKTLLCIAHRIKTIIGYDRICVMDKGQIAELDTPQALFTRNDSIFRSMCDRSGITFSDIQAALKDRERRK
ncbi:hypothetical protein BS47DRAFT_1395829 [Hydnum rufescens UP504]|uniref:ABC transporter n=1 Tax=Hydnum rufescens UP504 TaxID=1448309 RepID=A0A9P6ARI1_9AGAM|nr:hypothetical protein BS47DRAFT_1395829 [Hydnum rufescens UP504]